ncbi:hypothetical protein L1887_56521 [Cichorium endivia]|nr:hypothetical protein L1887_56521 [Cichorium endivia]
MSDADNAAVVSRVAQGFNKRSGRDSARLNLEASTRRDGYDPRLRSGHERHSSQALEEKGRVSEGNSAPAPSFLGNCRCAAAVQQPSAGSVDLTHVGLRNASKCESVSQIAFKRSSVRFWMSRVGHRLNAARILGSARVSGSMVLCSASAAVKLARHASPAVALEIAPSARP